MTKALKKIENIGIVFKDLSKIKQGETSDTFVGDYNNKKVILKVYKESKLKNKQNDLLNENLIRQLSDLKLFPKIIHISDEDNFFIYEYFESTSYEVDNNFIKKLGNKIKEVHETKPNIKINTFCDQINKYEIELEEINTKKVFKNLYQLINQTEKENNNLVFSHNDLNKNNILINKDICFIDYEYASLNNIHCDLARVIEEFGLNNSQAEHLIDCYGYRDKINFIQKIDIWKNINTYLDYIWILIMQKKGFISPKSDQYLQNLEKIKLLKQ